jgi:predicted RNA-binding protein with PUA-like domain
MKYFLAKTDPETYSIDQFAQEGTTVWDGVRNPQAARAIQQMKPDDIVFVYHSMGNSAVVGLARVVSEAWTDPKDPKSWVVRLKFVEHLQPPTTLATIKESGLFADWALVRQSRLSTMEAPPAFAAWMKQRYPASSL